MAVAKGATIPVHRMLDAVDATTNALEAFAQWAGVAASSPELDHLHAVDAMQIKLAAWQAKHFGIATDEQIALGVIEELGEAFDEDAGPEESIDALGDVMIYGAQICTANRLAIRPVIDLACLYAKANQAHAQPITLAGQLAHVVLKHGQNIRGLGPADAYRPRLVDALALMIAKAIEDCTIGHELVVDPHGVFEVIGGEVLARKVGDAMIPPAQPHVDGNGTVWVPKPTAEERKEQALESLQSGAELLEQAERTEPGDFEIPPR